MIYRCPFPPPSPNLTSTPVTPAKAGVQSTKTCAASLRPLKTILRKTMAAFCFQKARNELDRISYKRLELRMETLDEIQRRMRQKLEAGRIENPVLDARILVRQGGNFSDSDLITMGQTPLSVQQIETIEKFVDRRVAGEPVSRILGGREFYGRMFRLSPDTLDPRPDTETLIDAALKKPALRILDLGTGTGCILITLLAELPNATGVGVDINPGAVAISRENAIHHGVESRAEFRCGSWFDPLSADESFDLIVSNPPYIPESDIESLAVEVRNHDPRLALSGGDSGLEAYKNILMKIKNHLVCGGRALFEIGKGQEEALSRLVGESNMTPRESYRDMAGVLRVVEITCGEK